MTSFALRYRSSSDRTLPHFCDEARLELSLFDSVQASTRFAKPSLLSASSTCVGASFSRLTKVLLWASSLTSPVPQATDLFPNRIYKTKNLAQAVTLWAHCSNNGILCNHTSRKLSMRSHPCHLRTHSRHRRNQVGNRTRLAPIPIFLVIYLFSLEFGCRYYIIRPACTVACREDIYW